tara:strand:+ start:357 stop:611 length:255 start_codon:yes stop_codon:yes gene_type:complete
MSNELAVANVIHQISKGDLVLENSYQDKQLDAMTTTEWFQEQWDELCVAFPAARNMDEEEIIRMMNCFTCMFPNEAASIMVSES